MTFRSLRTCLVTGALVASVPIMSAAQAPASTRVEVELLVATVSNDSQLERWRAGTDAGPETVTEVRPGQPVWAHARIRGCVAESDGRCDLTAQFVVYRPDGSVAQEQKPQRVPVTAVPALAMRFGEQDRGLHRVVVVVRDLLGKRMVRAERIFDIRHD